jgi:hypothetical protein
MNEFEERWLSTLIILIRRNMKCNNSQSKLPNKPAAGRPLAWATRLNWEVLLYFIIHIVSAFPLVLLSYLIEAEMKTKPTRKCCYV